MSATSGEQSATLPDPPVNTGAIIHESVTVQTIAGVTRNTRINADARREYVASHSNIWGNYANGIHSLPTPVDDIMRDLGVDIYERMNFDPEVASLINTIKAAVLSQDVAFKSPIVDDSDPKFKRASEIRDHFVRAFQTTTPPMAISLDNMLDAIFLGNKIAEKVYREGDGADAGKFVLSKLSVKNRNALYFVVDIYGNVVGFTPAVTQDGKFAGVIDSYFGVGIFDPKSAELLPRSKFAVLAFRPKDGDPRGSSILRSAYNAWWLKMQIWPELLRYLSLFGAPGIVGFTSPDSRDTPKLDDTGAKVGMESPEEVMLSQLEAWRNGAVASFVAGSLVQIVQAQGNGEAFLKAIEVLNREISKGVTGQELATSEGRHQARAASEVHQDILELVIAFIKELVCSMISEEIVRPTILMNWGEAALELEPAVSLGKVQRQDKAALMSAYTAAGYELDPSQWIGVDSELDAPPRDPDSISVAVDNKQATIDAANTPKPVAGSNGTNPPSSVSGRSTTSATTNPGVQSRPSTPSVAPRRGGSNG